MSAEKIVLIIEVVLLSLMTVVVLYHLIEVIRRDIQIRKTSKIIDEAADKFMKKIDEAVIECITKDDKTKDKTKKVNKATTQENNNYNDMSVIELKKIAQKKKIKGYYNLHKEELVKALEEAETLQK